MGLKDSHSIIWGNHAEDTWSHRIFSKPIEPSNHRPPMCIHPCVCNVLKSTLWVPPPSKSHSMHTLVSAAVSSLRPSTPCGSPTTPIAARQRAVRCSQRRWWCTSARCVAVPCSMEEMCVWRHFHWLGVKMVLHRQESTTLVPVLDIPLSLPTQHPWVGSLLHSGVVEGEGPLASWFPPELSSTSVGKPGLWFWWESG